MCGVFGFATAGGRPDLRTLAEIATVTESRGPHAFGLAWIDDRHRLHAFRKTGRISDHLGLLAMARDARILIGHCRFATAGSPADVINNHPHPADAGWIVHNGVLPNHHRIVAGLGDEDLHPVSDCDSELIALDIESAPGTIFSRCCNSVRLAAGSPFVLLGLWARPARLVIVRAGNPLHWSRQPDGTYFASLPRGMAGAQSMPDGSAMEVRMSRAGECYASRRRKNLRKIPSHHLTPPGRNLY